MPRPQTRAHASFAWLLTLVLAGATSVRSQVSIRMAGADPAPVAGPDRLVLSAGSGAPLVFSTAEATRTDGPQGTRVEGTLALQSPLGALELIRTDATFSYGPGGPGAGYQTFEGSSEVPFPAVGPFDDFRVTRAARAAIAYREGRHLGHLGAPLQPHLRYLAFQIQEGFAGEFGGVELAVPGGKEAVLVLDPTDPFLFVTGDLPGLAKLGKLEGLGIGLSARGRIPFRPRTRWSLDPRTPTFDGHLYLSGTVPLKQYAMAIRGETVVRLERQVLPLGPRLLPTALGGNGTLLMEVPLLEFASFEMELGDASAAAIWDGPRSAAYFSGVGRPSVPFLPEDLPVLPERELKVAGMIDGSRLSESFLRGEGEYVMGLARLAELVGIELENLRETRGSLSISKRGFVAQGVTRSQFSPLVKAEGHLTLRSHFSLKEPTRDFSVRLEGALGVGGVDLGGKAVVELGPRKALVSGSFETPVQAIAVSGSLGRGTVALSGEAELKVPIRGATKVAEWVTNGSICGYEVVRDGARCGFDQVTDSAVCGTRMVADGGKCGWDWVSDGAVCGWDVVTSGAVCGYTTVESGAKCGWNTIKSGAECGWSWTKCLINPLKWGKCKKPKTCRKPKRCAIANTCRKAKRCRKPKRCRVANTCRVARSCEDLSKPRRCKRVVRIPDAHLGDLAATIRIGITERGASGSASGSYCLKGGKCLTVGGDVRFDPKPEACFELPAVGKRCIGI